MRYDNFGTVNRIQENHHFRTGFKKESKYWKKYLDTKVLIQLDGINKVSVDLIDISLVLAQPVTLTIYCVN